MRTKTRASRAPRSRPPQPPPNLRRAYSTNNSAGHERRRFDWSKRDTWISCAQGGQELLTCRARDCPIATHARCLRAEPSLNENGEFFCPFCWYKRQFARVAELREEARLARLVLHDFLQFKSSDCEGRGGNQLAEEEEEEEEEQEEEKGEGSEDSGSGAEEFESRPRRVEERKKENGEARAGRESVVSAKELSPKKDGKNGSEMAGHTAARGKARDSAKQSGGDDI